MTEQQGKKTPYFAYVKMARAEFQKMLLVHPELSSISGKELDVLEELLSDKTLAAVADSLCISYSTAHFHCRNLYRKLGVSSRQQLLIRYKDLY